MTAESREAGRSEERTALAWQRTALSLVATAAVLMRLTIDTMGMLVLPTLGASASLATWVLLEARRRRSRAITVGTPASRGGWTPLTVTLTMVLLGATGLLALSLDHGLSAA